MRNKKKELSIIIVSAIDYQRSLTVPGELTEVIAVQSIISRASIAGMHHTLKN